MQNSSFLARLGNGIKQRLGSVLNSPYKKAGIGWFTEKYYKHLATGRIRHHTLFGKNFFFYNPQELLHGLKEIFVEEIYKQELTDKPYIIDCGANMGLSILYMKLHYPNAEIIGFEPDETNFDLLSRNIESYGLKHVEIRKEAIWKENTILTFSNEGSMSSKITDRQSENTRNVQATRLKDLLCRQVDFLKIDIEGAEFEVVTDAADHLYHVQNMFIEYHGNYGHQAELTSIFNLLTQKGFLYYIKEATSVYHTPFYRVKAPHLPYDIQLNIFCFRPALQAK